MICCEKCCKNIVDVAIFFFNSSPDFGNQYLFIFFPPIFGNGIATIATKIFFPISAMALLQLVFGQQIWAAGISVM